MTDLFNPSSLSLCVSHYLFFFLFLFSSLKKKRKRGKKKRERKDMTCQVGPKD